MSANNKEISEIIQKILNKKPPSAELRKKIPELIQVLLLEGNEYKEQGDTTRAKMKYFLANEIDSYKNSYEKDAEIKIKIPKIRPEIQKINEIYPHITQYRKGHKYSDVLKELEKIIKLISTIPRYAGGSQKLDEYFQNIRMILDEIYVKSLNNTVDIIESLGFLKLIDKHLSRDVYVRKFIYQLVRQSEIIDKDINKLFKKRSSDELIIILKKAQTLVKLLTNEGLKREYLKKIEGFIQELHSLNKIDLVDVRNFFIEFKP